MIEKIFGEQFKEWKPILSIHGRNAHVHAHWILSEEMGPEQLIILLRDGSHKLQNHPEDKEEIMNKLLKDSAQLKLDTLEQSVALLIREQMQQDSVDTNAENDA